MKQISGRSDEIFMLGMDKVTDRGATLLKTKHFIKLTIFDCIASLSIYSPQMEVLNFCILNAFVLICNLLYIFRISDKIFCFSFQNENI